MNRASMLLTIFLVILISSSVDTSSTEVRILQKVHFLTDSSEILPEYLKVLELNSLLIKEHPEWQVIIEGHCDARGSEEYNLILGKRRAAAVKEFLVNLGVPPEDLVTISLGESQPLHPGHDARAFAINRRVQFKTEKKEGI